MTAPEKPGPSEFERMATSSQPGLFAEFVEFLSQNRKWWLIPILLLLGMVGVLAILGSTGIAPFIYTLF